MVLLQCDGVATLPGWQQSRGAVLEVTTALSVGLPIQHLTTQDFAHYRQEIQGVAPQY